MDRGSFLSSLPYLLPSSAATPNKDSSRTEVLLKDYHVSIESIVVVSRQQPKWSPIAFAIQQQDQDAAMCSFDMTLETIIISSSMNDTSDIKSRNSTSPNLLILSDTPQKKDPEQKIVHVCIDGRHFQLDVRHLQRLELQQQEGYQPGCLLLCFESILFRIFSLNRMDSDEYYELQSAQHRLNTLLGSALSIQQVSSFDLYSPANSSQRSSSSEAQTSDKKKRTAIDDSQNRKIQRRRLSYKQAQTSVTALESLLDMPVSHFQKDESILDRMGPLLTNVADDLAASYCRSTDLARSIQASLDDDTTAISKLDQALNHFFPAMRHKPRHNKKKTTTTIASVQETIATVSEIVEAQKEAIQERHQLLLLPSRG